MKSITYLLFFFVNFYALGQTIQFHPGETTICYASDIVENTSVPNQLSKGRINAEPTVEINVVYNGFTDEAKKAFQYAVDIWARTITSEVPIRITANWSQLGSGVLGSASSTNTISNFKNAPISDVRYPIALAEKLARKQLNLTTQSEITSNFNSEIDWYFGTDANPPSDQYDMVSVVLHEIGHGLGFSSSFGANAQVAVWGLSNSGQTNTPIIYDLYLQDALGNQIIDESVYPNNSAELLVAVSNNNVVYGSSLAKDINTQFPSIYAPNPWNGGSSISHLDESVFPAGSSNSLMSPQFGLGEAIHLPGVITEAIFAELGWVHTFLSHEEILFAEEENMPVTFILEIASDSSVFSENIELIISEDNFSSSSSFSLSQTAQSGHYETSIPYADLSDITSYYFKYTSPEGRFYYSPRDSSSNAYTLIKEVDDEQPFITHLQEGFISSEAFGIAFNVLDNFGLDSVYLALKTSNDGQITFHGIELNDDTEDYEFLSTRTDFDLNNGDTLFYQIYAVDKSINKNTSIYPREGFIIRPALDLGTALEYYALSFDSEHVSDSIMSNNFILETPENFTTKNINSIHPYENGSKGFASIILKHPIILTAQSILSLDEIVLLEPSEGLLDSDYLTIEGSVDAGENWIQIDEKVNAEKFEGWTTKFNSELSTSGSSAVGDPSLYRTREISLISPELPFRINDELVIRISMVTNEEINGWGINIDNIIAGKTPITGIINDKHLNVYPNPTHGHIYLSHHSEIASISIKDLTGKMIKRYHPIQIETIDLSELNPGAYLAIIEQKDSNKATVIKIIKK
ncbi:T9SS type A sorting domain-containing protein [Ekhidna sp.]|uniref:T9SS type A sorting domain-containing protein n=1 Tax=Ekhidna sp. TaxID=2608089 RepID=UPI003B50063E